MIVDKILSSKFGNYKISLDIRAIDTLDKLLDLARKENFQPRIVSAYRSIQYQRQIWNAKLLLKRPIMDNKGNLPLNVNSFSPEELIWATARWSAFPGFSRHHWGIDFDIIDEKFYQDLKDIQLIPMESEKNGPSYEFHLWLKNIKTFKNPYNYYNLKNGIGPEPWHISVTNLSQEFEALYNRSYWEKCVQEYASLGVFYTIIEDISLELYQHYTINF